MAMQRRLAQRDLTLAAGMLLAAGSLTQPVSATAETISFFVVGPNGMPVVKPYVLTWVSGSNATPEQARGSEDGQVTMAVPDADPVAAARIAAGEPINLISLVMDKEPGNAGINAVYVAAALNLTGAAGLPVDLARVGGHVYTLAPSLTDFVQVSDGAEPPDDPDCHDENMFLFGVCHVSEWPPWAYNTPVPIADNYGGGRDFVATMEYETATVTTSSIAVNAGVSGFFEAGGGHAYENTDVTGLGFGPSGPSRNQRAYLLTTFKRTKGGTCWENETGRHCQVTTVYEPGRAHGTRAEDYPDANDTLDPVLDCFTEVDKTFSKGKGTSRRQWFTFKLGPSETWSTALGFQETGFLHAQTTVTSEITSREDHVRKWEVVPADVQEFPFHYVMVKGGMARYNRLIEGGGAGNCPIEAPADTWTHADSPDYIDPVEDTKDEAEDVSHIKKCDEYLPLSSTRSTSVFGADPALVLGPCQ